MENSENTKRPPIREKVRSFYEILSSLDDPFIDLLLRWEDIVGADNVRKMIPLRIEEKTLVVAVPNNMVLSIAARCKNRLLEAINESKVTQHVENIKFLLDIKLFANNIKNEKTWRK
ncbi:DUF721 domain-containing protein [bacterium]|nr:DUF721 domain-containing protein [bacterium]